MTIVLGCLLILLSVASLFVGVIDVNIPGLFSGGIRHALGLAQKIIKKTAAHTENSSFPLPVPRRFGFFNPSRSFPSAT